MCPVPLLKLSMNPIELFSSSFSLKFFGISRGSAGTGSFQRYSQTRGSWCSGSGKSADTFKTITTLIYSFEILLVTRREYLVQCLDGLFHPRRRDPSMDTKYFTIDHRCDWHHIKRLKIIMKWNYVKYKEWPDAFTSMFSILTWLISSQTFFPISSPNFDKHSR